MKSPTLFLLLLCLASTLAAQAPSHAPKAYERGDLTKRCLEFNEKVAQKAAKTQTDLPGTCYTLAWNAGTMAWDSSSRDMRTYKFAAGEARIDTSVVAYYNNQWNTASRYIYNYDTWGNETRAETQNWDGFAFEDRSIYTAEYDAFGTVLRQILLDYNGTTWDTSVHTRALATYNAQNLPIDVIFEERDIIAQTWLPTNRVNRSFNANLELDSSVIFLPNNGAWRPYTQIRDYVWYNYAKDLATEYYSDLWDTGTSAFLPLEFATATYTDANGSGTEYYLLYNSSTQVYDSSARIVREIDAWGNSTLLTYSTWDSQTSTWNMAVGERIAFTYNAYGSIVEAVVEIYSPADGWVNDERFVCQDFVVGSAPEATAVSFANWASHPVGVSGKLVVDVREAGMLSVEVMDLEGRMLRTFSTQHVGGQQVHEFELGLSAGIYVYRVHLNDREGMGKLMVQ